MCAWVKKIYEILTKSDLSKSIMYYNCMHFVARDQDQNIKYLSVYYSIEKVNTQCSSMVQCIFTARAKARIYN